MNDDNPLARYYKSQIKGEQKPTRKNQKPEFTQTVVPCMRWLVENGFSGNRIEAKAVWSPSAGRYLAGQTDSGVADWFGCCPDGLAAFIEFKAPGKLRTLKPHQRDWLALKAGFGCFAVVVDSVQDLSTKWLTFQAMRKINRHVDWSLSQLPKISTQVRSDSPDVPF